MKETKKILYIDDDTEFAQDFINYASKFNIIVEYENNFEDMKSNLKKNISKYCAVVLDIRCFSKKDQEIADVAFIGKARDYLISNFKYLKRFIFSADEYGISSFTSTHKEDKLFLKTSKGRNELIKAISNIDNIELRIRSSYQDIFDIFSKGLLSKDLENQFLSLVKQKDSKEKAQIYSNLVSIRRIQEGMLQELNKRKSNILPNNLFHDYYDKKKGQYWQIHNHLAGNRDKENEYMPTTEVYLDGFIEKFSKIIYQVTSDDGAHTPFEISKYSPTNYTVNSLLNALCDQLIWYNNLLEM